MAAGEVVGAAADEHELSVGDLVVRIDRAVHPLEVPEARQQQPEDVRLEQALPESLHHLPPADGKEVGAERRHGVHRPREQCGAVTRVGVGEEQDWASRGERALVAGPLLAEPTVGKIGVVDHAHAKVVAGDGPRDGACAIRGVVVHDDDFERRPGGREQGAKAGVNIPGLVPRGDDD